MKNLATSFLISILFFILPASGCSNSPESAVDAQKATADLTADDLAHANHIRWWFVKIPEVPKGKRLSMAFVDDKGVIESRGCPDVKEGDRLKCVLSGFSRPDLRFSLVTENDDYRSTITNHLKGYDGPSIERGSGAEVSIGQIVIKKSNANSVKAIKDPLKAHEIGLKFIFEDEAQPWKRDGYEWPGKVWKMEILRRASLDN